MLLELRTKNNKITMTKYQHLTLVQRRNIQLCLQYHLKYSEIAELIGVHKSTISREIERNTINGKYSCGKAHRAATLREKILKHNPQKPTYVWKLVVEKLKQHWSPEQIANVLSRDGDKICTETIYKFIRADKKQGGNLYQYCRFGMKHRRHIIADKAGVKHIPHRRDISERPIECNPPFFGNFEMDLIVGAKHKGAILTIVERTTQYLIAVKLPYGHNSLEVAKEVVKALDVFKGCIRSITTDNGIEFAEHRYISRRLHCPIYFTQPYKSWQKGLIEKSNQLLRQYLPKKMPLDEITQEELQSIVCEINNRPRRKLFYKNPQNICLEQLLTITFASETTLH